MRRFGRLFAALGIFATIGLITLSVANAAPPFGGKDSQAYAAKLWTALTQARLAGAGALHTKPYEGEDPHGAILETIDTTLAVGGHSGAVIVKRNYGPKGITAEQVANNPGKYLKAVTVMFKREKGYDADNQDWFWAKFNPNGSLQMNPKKMALAGRVAKGMDAGCIACHKAAPGGDYVFLSDRIGM